MLAARITLAHFSMSFAMSVPNSAGVPASDMPPKSTNLALILGSANPTLISLLSLLTISGGTPLGAARPNQSLDSYPGRNSPMVGVLGSDSERVFVVTASPYNRPALTNSIDDAKVAKDNCTCPPSKSL